jgi:hypothetical protein
VSKTSSIIGEAFLGVAAIGLAPFTGGASLALYGLGASLLLGAAAQALAPAPQLGTGAGGGQSAATVGIQGPVPAERMVFGTTGVKGTPVWFKASADQIKGKHDREYALIPYILTRRRALGDLLAIWVQGHRVPLVQHTGWITYFPPTGLVADPSDKYHGNIHVHWEPGDGSAGFWQWLINRSGGGWDASHTLTGISYAGTTLVFDPVLWPQPEFDLTFELQGHRLWDPRTGVVAFSRNPALAWLHALTGVHGPRGGISMDLVNLDSVIAAANVCDEQLTKKDGTVVPRYAIDGTWDTTEDFENVEQQILATMAGTRVKSGATYYLYAGAARPLVADLTTDDLAGVYSISPEAGPRRALQHQQGAVGQRGKGLRRRRDPELPAGGRHPVHGAGGPERGGPRAPGRQLRGRGDRGPGAELPAPRQPVPVPGRRPDPGPRAPAPRRVELRAGPAAGQDRPRAAPAAGHLVGGVQAPRAAAQADGHGDVHRSGAGLGPRAVPRRRLATDRDRRRARGQPRPRRVRRRSTPGTRARSRTRPGPAARCPDLSATPILLDARR